MSEPHEKPSTYIRKFYGQGAASPPRVKSGYIFWSAIGAFTGILLLAAITIRAGVPAMIGSFGASAVLIFAAIEGPLSQPRNLLGGHIISACIGVSIYQLMGRSDFTIALAVSSAIAAMLWTRTLHPPGGATALIAVDTQQGFGFILYPVLLGALLLLVVAVVVNNLPEDRIYPRFWY